MMIAHNITYQAMYKVVLTVVMIALCGLSMQAMAGTKPIYTGSHNQAAQGYDVVAYFTAANLSKGKLTSRPNGKIRNGYFHRQKTLLHLRKTLKNMRHNMAVIVHGLLPIIIQHVAVHMLGILSMANFI